ncbi:MAG: hypothetical protein HYV68_00430 [Candidatus Taylorbacteria bacterium]|nr:hypothetical protein [Candidatus Taylorbacteria bacterium]
MHIDLREAKTQYVIGGSIIALMFVGWIFFSKTSPEEPGGLTESVTDPIETIIGRELLESLEKMKKVTLDTSFLNDPVYLSLIDLSVEVPELPKGRRDPFAPFGANDRPANRR